MNDHSRRLLCRAGFVLICFVPTLIVLWYIWSPQASARWESRLRAHTGLQVHVRKVSRWSPTATSLENVQLIHPATGKRIVAGQIQIQNHANSTSVTLHQVIADHSALEQLVKNVTRNLVDNRQLGQQLRLVARDILIHRDRIPGTDEFRLTKLVVEHLERNGIARVKALAYAEDDSEQLVALDYEHHRGDGPPRRDVLLRTQGISVPCWLGPHELTWTEVLGEHAEFSGQFFIRQLPGGSSGKISGRFDAIDLRRVVETRFARLFRGAASLSLGNCEFFDGRIRSASGNLTCDQGKIDSVLVANLRDQFGWKVNTSSLPTHRFDLVDQQGRTLRSCQGTDFRQMNVPFQLSGEKLSFGDQSQVIARDAGGAPLFSVEPDTVRHVLHLVAVLTRTAGGGQPPLSHEAARLSSHLWLPSSSLLDDLIATQPSESDGRSDQTRLR